MPKPEWGVKRTCQSCATRFYDLMRDPIVCPNCGATFDLTTATKPRRPRAVAKASPVVEEAEVDLVDTEDEDNEEETGDEDEPEPEDDRGAIEVGDEDEEEDAATADATPDDDADDDDTEDDDELGDFTSDVLLDDEDDEAGEDFDELGPERKSNDE